MCDEQLPGLGGCQAVIFDFDGLLMDTETTLLRSWQFEWQQWGLEPSPDGFFASHGGDISADRYAELAKAVGPHFDQPTSHRRRLNYRQQCLSGGGSTGLRFD